MGTRARPNPDTLYGPIRWLPSSVYPGTLRPDYSSPLTAARIRAEAEEIVDNALPKEW